MGRKMKRYVFKAVVKYEIVIDAATEDDAVDLANLAAWSDWTETDNDIWIEEVEDGQPDRFNGHDD